MLSCFNEAVNEADELIAIYGRFSKGIFQSRKAHTS